MDMVKNNINTSTNVNDNINSNSNNASFSYNTNTQNNQDFNESVNRALDQTKDNINKSIAESKSQIPQYTNIVNSYQEQTLQAAQDITEHFIESQKTIINSIQSSWRPFSENYSTNVNNTCNPQTAANAYSRLVSTIADNSITALRTANNLVFSSLDAFKTTMEHARETTKQIIDINTKTAKTLEQNALAVQDSASRLNASFINNQGNTENISGTTSTTTSAA
jgi:hypothetical protein